MKTRVVMGIVLMSTFALGVNALAYEGGSKMVAAFAHPEKGEAEFGPLSVVPSEVLTPGKPIVQMLHRLPQPTLSVERIREERPGRSLGTKAVVLFQSAR